jgi:hypothetical protein
MNDRVATAREEIEKAASIARTLEHADGLAALCYDVLSRQAEGQSLFSGKKFVAGRAKAHGVQREAAQTPFGDLLALLERGPQSRMQFGLIAALFVRGFEHAVRAEPQHEKALVAKLAANCDWLELSSPYRVIPLLDALLEPELAGAVHAALGALILRDDTEAAEPEVRARNAGRIAGLAEARTPAARTALERIEATAADAFSRALSACALGRALASRSAVTGFHIRGHLQGSSHGALATFLGWISGWSLLRWALRLPLAVIGYGCDLEAELSGDAVRVRRTTSLLGRTMQVAEQVYPLFRLRSAERGARFPTLHFVLGTFCLALGVVLGGVFAFDAARTGDRALWLIAGALLLLGSGLDLVLEVLVPGGRSRVVLDLDFGPRHRMRIAGVTIEQADGFLEALWQRLSRAQGVARALA